MTSSFIVLIIVLIIACIVLTLCTLTAYNWKIKDFSDKCIFVFCLLLTIICYASTIMFIVSGNTTVEVSIVRNDSSIHNFLLKHKNYDYDRHGITIYTDSVNIRMYDVKEIKILDVKN